MTAGAYRRTGPGSEGRLLPQSARYIAAATEGRPTTSKVSLDSEYRYNPLHNDLDAHALAYNIASLLNNLFGKGKEPFCNRPTRTL